MKKEILAICVLGVLVCFFLLTTEKNPAYMYHQTTWESTSAFGKLNHDGTYSFYRINNQFGYEIPGVHIVTLPTGEAARLH